MVCFRYALQKMYGRQKYLQNIIQYKKMSTSNLEVIFEEFGNKGLVTLNRPKQLNALNLNMIQLMYPVLKKWENSKDLVILKGAGSKAFCAGGDVVSIRTAGLSGDDLTKKFFKEEYRLNCLIGTYQIPHISLLNGITMGGGVGLSVHGQFRVATENTLFAMPETALGLFPDVGGSYFLPRLGANLGTFLGLTGYRVKSRETVTAGIATHFCDSNKLPDLEKELLNLKSSHIEEVSKVLNEYEEKSEIDKEKEFSLKSYLNVIKTCFDGNSVEDVINKLEKSDCEFARKQIGILRKSSPTSLKVTFEALKRGAHLSLQEVLIMEYRLSQRFCEDNDFFEGVRSILVDKDGSPKWKPATIEDVSREAVERYFSSLTSTPELTF